MLITDGCHQQEGTAVAGHTGPLVVHSLAVGHSPGLGLRSPAGVRALAAGVLERISIS